MSMYPILSGHPYVRPLLESMRQLGMIILGILGFASFGMGITIQPCALDCGGVLLYR